jgi:hypothetical protein
MRVGPWKKMIGIVRSVRLIGEKSRKMRSRQSMDAGVLKACMGRVLRRKRENGNIFQNEIKGAKNGVVKPMRLEIGDRVWIKEPSALKREQEKDNVGASVWITDAMLAYAGRAARITAIRDHSTNHSRLYLLDIDYGRCAWEERMFGCTNARGNLWDVVDNMARDDNRRNE